jgi:hypothetical protein
VSQALISQDTANHPARAHFSVAIAHGHIARAALDLRIF